MCAKQISAWWMDFVFNFHLLVLRGDHGELQFKHRLLLLHTKLTQASLTE